MHPAPRHNLGAQEDSNLPVIVPNLWIRWQCGKSRKEPGQAPHLADGVEDAVPGALQQHEHARADAADELVRAARPRGRHDQAGDAAEQRAARQYRHVAVQSLQKMDRNKPEERAGHTRHGILHRYRQQGQAASSLQLSRAWR